MHSQGIKPFIHTAIFIFVIIICVNYVIKIRLKISITASNSILLLNILSNQMLKQLFFKSLYSKIHLLSCLSSKYTSDEAICHFKVFAILLIPLIDSNNAHSVIQVNNNKLNTLNNEKAFCWVIYSL